MPLFEVAILEMPSKKELEDGTAVERLAFGPKFVVAKDAQSAAIRAVLDNAGDAGKVDQARMQVLVRPFA